MRATDLIHTICIAFPVVLSIEILQHQSVMNNLPRNLAAMHDWCFHVSMHLQPGFSVQEHWLLYRSAAAAHLLYHACTQKANENHCSHQVFILITQAGEIKAYWFRGERIRFYQCDCCKGEVRFEERSWKLIKIYAVGYCSSGSEGLGYDSYDNGRGGFMDLMYPSKR